MKKLNVNRWQDSFKEGSTEAVDVGFLIAGRYLSCLWLHGKGWGFGIMFTALGGAIVSIAIPGLFGGVSGLFGGQVASNAPPAARVTNAVGRATSTVGRTLLVSGAEGLNVLASEAQSGYDSSGYANAVFSNPLLPAGAYQATSSWNASQQQQRNPVFVNYQQR